MIRDILARTVSASILGVDVVVSLPDGDVSTRGTWMTTEEDRDVIAGDGIVAESVIRTPISGLPSEPTKGTRIEIAGDVFKADRVLRRGANWLITLERVAVR